MKTLISSAFQLLRSKTAPSVGVKNLRRIFYALLCICVLSPTIQVSASDALKVRDATVDIETIDAETQQPETSNADSLLLKTGNSDAGAEVMQLTYEEAYEMAMANLTEISQIDNNLKQNEAKKLVFEQQIKDLGEFIRKEKSNTRGYNDIIEELEEDIDDLNDRIMDSAYDNEGQDEDILTTVTLTAERDALRQSLANTKALLNSKDNSENSRKVLEKNIEMLSKETELMQLRQEAFGPLVEYSLRNIMLNLAGYNLDIELMEDGIALDEENLKRVELLNQLGKASDIDLQDAEYKLEQSRENMERILTAKKSAREKLNTLLHQPLSQEIVIEYSIKDIELPEDVDKYVETVFTSDPAVKEKKLMADIRKLEYELNGIMASHNMSLYRDDLADFRKDQDYLDEKEEIYELVPELEPEHDIDDNTGLLSLNQSEWNYKQAERDRDNALLAMENAARELADVRLDIESSVHTRLNALEQINQREKALLTEIENAEEQLGKLEVRLDAGNALQYEMDMARYSISQLNVELEKIKASRWLEQFLIQHPLLIEA